MGSFERQVKSRGYEIKRFFSKGPKVIVNSCKKGWRKIKHLRK